MAELLAGPCQNVVTDGPPPRRCGDESFATVKAGCVNGHVSEMRACWGCAVDLQMEPGPWTCPHCLSEATAVITWDSGETTTIGEVARG